MSIQQFTKRQIALLPPWFGDDFPNLIATLTGSAVCNDFVYGLLQYVRLQSRLQTMTGETLDLFAQTFFGKKLLRHFGEGDDAYRKRISASLLRPGATRPAMVQVLTDLTGQAPIIIEGTNTTDIGAYNKSLFYNRYGGLGWSKPYTAIIFAFRPAQNGQIGIGGYNQTSFGGFGYNFNYNNAYADDSGGNDIVTDQDILDAIEETKPYGTHIYAYIEGESTPDTLISDNDGILLSDNDGDTISDNG